MFDQGGAVSSNSYFDLQKRIQLRLRSAGLDDQVLELLRNAYEKALAAENLVLSRVEKSRLSTEVLKSVLANLGRRLEDDLAGG